MTTARRSSSLEGVLEHITYVNAANHYTVAKLKVAATAGLITVIGHLPGVASGETLKMSGGWDTHPRYGQQFKVERFEIVQPASVEGIQKYLSSGIIRGIGPSLALRLVRHFGDRTLEIIAGDGHELLEVEGIGPVKAAQIARAWHEHQELKNIMQYLQANGVNAAHGARVLKAYGTDAIQVLSRDPYRLVEDIPEIGFPVADALGVNLDVAPDCGKRLRAGLLHLLEHRVGEGHTYCHLDDLMTQADGLTGVDRESVRNALEYLQRDGEVIIATAPDDSCRGAVYLRRLHTAETTIAARLTAMLAMPVAPAAMERTELTAAVLNKIAVALSAEQLDVLQDILSCRLALLTGGPGTGKTTLIRALTAVAGTVGKKIALVAPTGRAARRLSEVTERPAATIHKLLGFNWVENRFERDRDDPLQIDMLIVDEASMVDAPLMCHLLEAVPLTAAVILVGDEFQLPPVGPGNVLADLIKAGCIPVFELTRIFRQASRSPIVVNAHQVRRGEPLGLEPVESRDGLTEFAFVHAKRPETAVDTIVDLCRRDIPRQLGLDSIADIQILTPMHRGLVGTLHLNQVMQKALNRWPQAAETGGTGFRIGDKVMHLKNNYTKEVFNGDIGRVTNVDGNRKRLTVEYYDRPVAYEFGELDELSLAYAISVHKSQGSEYPAVVMPLSTQHYVMLQRNLLYTAITRARRLVILVGTRRALELALHNDQPRRRLSSLARRLMTDETWEENGFQLQ